MNVLPLAPEIDLMTSDERFNAIARILAKGALRLIEKRAQEALEDREFGEELAAEVANLPGGAT